MSIVDRYTRTDADIRAEVERQYEEFCERTDGLSEVQLQAALLGNQDMFDLAQLLMLPPQE